MSPLSCKPGDLAIVVLATETPEMLGRIVRIERPAVEGEEFISTTGGSTFFFFEVPDTAWVISSSSAMPWRDNRGLKRLFKERVFADRALRPIKPLEELDDVTRANEVAQ